MAIQEATSAPAFLAPEEQETTPATFEGLAPFLRVHLENAQVAFRPQAPAWLVAEDHSGANGSSALASQAALSGELWVTDAAITFLSSASPQKGFTLDYPSLSMHAVSRSLPESLASEAGASSDRGCIYCQIESDPADGADGQEGDENDIDILEMWIVPASQQGLDPLFESLSYCASLHPSAPGEDDGSGNPFASMGAFGTGLMGRGGALLGEQQQQEAAALDGAFDDVEQDGDGAPRASVGQGLTDSGRATMKRLESLIEVPSNIASSSKLPSETTNTNGSASRRPTNTLILVGVPQEVFEHTELAAALLDLLNAYGSLFSWTPLPSFGRAIIVYEEVEGAQRAKGALDRLLLPLIEEDALDDAASELGGEEELHQTADAGRGNNDAVLRAYYGEVTDTTYSMGDGENHLPVPTTDRNFLISPPGSPPVGWEPIREDPPNTTTLADDLMRALGSLRDKGLGVRSHEPVNRSRRSSFAEGASLMPPASPQAPQRMQQSTRAQADMIIAPRETSVRSTHPLAQETYDPSAGAVGNQPIISLPGVSVQQVDPDMDDDDAQLEARANAGLSISSVKATVESMRGPTSFPSGMASPSEGNTRITPTSRPPVG